MDSRQVAKPIRKLIDGYLRRCARVALTSWSTARTWNRNTARLRYCQESKPAPHLRTALRKTSSHTDYSPPPGGPVQLRSALPLEFIPEEELSGLGFYLRGLCDVGPFRHVNPMTLARLKDSDKTAALAELCGYEDIDVCHITPTFLGYLSLCQLYLIQFTVPIDDGHQCLVCLTYTPGCKSDFHCDCHSVQLSLLQDLRCWCNCMICECDDVPPMCLDPDQLDLIHRQIRMIYVTFFRIRVVTSWNDEMSHVFVQVEMIVVLCAISTTIRTSQFEPP